MTVFWLWRGCVDLVMMCRSSVFGSFNIGLWSTSYNSNYFGSGTWTTTNCRLTPSVPLSDCSDLQATQAFAILAVVFATLAFLLHLVVTRVSLYYSHRSLKSCVCNSLRLRTNTLPLQRQPSRPARHTPC